MNHKNYISKVQQNYTVKNNLNYMKHIKNNFLVVSDYSWLPQDIEDSWVHKYSDNYLIYDKAHRLPQSDKVKWQKNVGQNHYDMFDFIVTHYDSLPECTIFCRSCFMWPKDTGIPKFDSTGKRISTGNCTEDYFLKNANNTTFTELQDFTTEPWRFDGFNNKIGPDNSYLERNTPHYFYKHPGKYYTNLNTFLKDMYKDPPHLEYIRFSPGGNYIIPKSYILKYSKHFYEKIKDILSGDIITGEIHMIERITYFMFTENWEVKDEYAKK